MRVATEAPDGVEAPSLYSEWHNGKQANGLVMANFKWPKEVYPWGRVVDIQYKSDKFDDDWDIFTYVHGASSKPEIWAAISKPDIPGVTSEELLRSNIVRDFLNLPTLAVLQSLDVEGASGIIHLDFEDRPEGPPNMAGTEDRKTLVILHPKWPMFIRGGQMTITAAGIKK
jgi:hypothetical protein